MRLSGYATMWWCGYKTNRSNLPKLARRRVVTLTSRRIGDWRLSDRPTNDVITSRRFGTICRRSGFAVLAEIELVATAWRRMIRRYARFARHANKNVLPLNF